MQAIVSHPTRKERFEETLHRSGDPTFAIAFGGGGARGLAHIHIIEAMDELGITPVAISGTSIGAIMGAAVASGVNGAEIHAYACSVLGRSAELAARMWKARPQSLADMLDGGVRLGQFNVERIIRSFMPDGLAKTFEELTIPLQVSTTDYYAHEEFVLDSGEIVHALGASSALPAIFKPVGHEGRLLIDGGFSNPVPFDLLKGKADVVVAIDVVGGPEEVPGLRPASTELLFGATHIMMRSIVSLKLKEFRPHILLRPPVSRFNVMDFMKIESVLAETLPIKDQFKRAIEQAVEEFAARR